MRGKGTEKEIEREFGEIEIDTAQITNPRRRDKFLVRNSLNKIEIIRVALKFFVAWGRLADNYVPYLHISRDRPPLQVLLGFNTRRAGSASEFISADNKERTSLFSLARASVRDKRSLRRRLVIAVSATNRRAQKLTRHLSTPGGNFLGSNLSIRDRRAVSSRILDNSAGEFVSLRKKIMSRFDF